MVSDRRNVEQRPLKSYACAHSGRGAFNRLPHSRYNGIMSRRSRRRIYETPPPADPIREELRALTKARIRQLIAQKEQIKECLALDPDLPLRQRELDRRALLTQILEMQGLIHAVTPYVQRLRPLVPEITEPTLHAACYLLLCQALQSFQAILLLAAEGFHYQMSELLRGIREALDLVVLFLCEEQQSPNLKKWFDGEIISNQLGREALDQFINEVRTDPLPVKERKAGIYGALSKFNHMSYAALIDSIDVFERDFDTRRVAGFYRANMGTLPSTKGEIRAMIVTMKQLYLSLGDNTAAKELDIIFTSL